MENLRVYADFTCFDWICINKDDDHNCNTLFDLILDYCDIIFSLDEAAIQHQISTNVFLQGMIMSKPSRKVIDIPDFLLPVEEMNIENYARDIFILDKDDNECAEYRQKKGLIVISIFKLEYFAELAKYFQKKLASGQAYEPKPKDGRKNWRYIIEEQIRLPINAAVLIDSYLFNDWNAYKSENLFEILMRIIPKTLDIPFHLTIVTDDNGNVNTAARLNALRTEIQQYLSNNGVNNFKLEIVTHTGRAVFHKRQLIANYFSIRAERGFNIFRKGVVNNANEVEIKGHYRNCNSTIGDTDFEMAYEKLDEVRAHKQLSSHNNSGIGELVVEYFNNRLLS